MAALLVRQQRELAGQGSGPRICLTIHNLAYQGLFPASQFPLTNLPWDYFTPAGVEFYGRLNCLKAAIVYSDVITTVSPRYAREIMTEEMGCGLDGLLRQRQNVLFGILNGVDHDEWNPMSDPFLKHPYSAEELHGKAANKLELQKEFGLPVRAQAVIDARNLFDFQSTTENGEALLQLGQTRRALRGGISVRF